MFTYKFLGLAHADNPAPFYYGSLPAKPNLGHVLKFNETGNRYVIYRIAGEGLVGDGPASQQKLALTEIVRGESVPTVWLQKLEDKEMEPQGRSFGSEEMKEYSQKNRTIRKKKVA